MRRITVRVHPNASKNEIIESEDGSWKAKLTSPPHDGKANEALIRLLADEFDRAPSEIRIVRGKTGKTKLVEIP